MSHITKKDIEVGLKDREDFISMVAQKKYCHQGESSFDDVIERVVQEFTKVSKYSSEEDDSIAKLLRDGKFIPAGSILYGLGNTEVRCSLSNCYLIKIEEDSLEGIFEAQKKMSRTYALRGGCGTDITILRPKSSSVDNAAKTSSGAVSFMPLFSEVTQTIGQNGRRGALLVSLDIRHPDALDFIWSKANPERVFGKDNLTGRVPDISGANISLKVTDDFMNAYENDEEWEFIFPDIEANKELYNKEWDGNYDAWLKNGYPVKSFGKVPAREIFKDICEANWSCGDPGMLFIDRVQQEDPASAVHESLVPMGTNPCFSGDTLIATSNGPTPIKDLVGKEVTVFDGNAWVQCNNFRVTGEGQQLLRIHFREDPYIDVTPYHTMYLEDGSKLQAKELKPGDALDSCYPRGVHSDRGIIRSIECLPGEHTVYCCTIPTTHKIALATGIITGQCGEQPLGYWNNCLLAALVLHKFVINPWTDSARFDWVGFEDAVWDATLFLDTMSDINMSKHPLQEQRDADRFGKRIGLEFTGLADALAMLGIKYGSDDSLRFCSQLTKAMIVKQLYASCDLAHNFGCCDAFNDPDARIRFCNSLFVKNLYLDTELRLKIVQHGLRNVGFNTVGPCGSISIMAGNCSSGIEPIFKFSYQRATRLSDTLVNCVHGPALDHVESNPSKYENMTLEELRDSLSYVEADAVSPSDRIAVQAAIQKYISASISSTTNLPREATAEQMEDIYYEAWGKGLKGITVFRDGCKDGVLISKDSSSSMKTEKHEDEDTLALPSVVIRDLLEVERARRHRVLWKGAKMYIIVSLDDDDIPVEVFAKLPREAGINGGGVYSEAVFNEKYALWETITRLVSLLLRSGIPLEYVIKQLDKGSYSLVDASAVIARILRTYLPEVDAEEAEIIEQELGAVCTECGKKTYVYENGCGHCLSCGYTTCG